MVPIGEHNDSKYGNCFSENLHLFSDYQRDTGKYVYHLDSSPLYI